jgi:iron(III) transport system substrate-binding protein
LLRPGNNGFALVAMLAMKGWPMHAAVNLGRRTIVRLAASALTAFPSILAQGGLDDMREAAASAGELVIFANTEEELITELIRAFTLRQPRTKVRYRRQLSEQLYDRFLEDIAAHTRGPDLVWSSAMDLQMKLVNDGYAQTYVSSEIGALPSWAIWANQAYGITAEPVVVAFDKRKLPTRAVPRTHAELTRLLMADPDLYRGKVATFDPERSGVGLLFLSEDVRTTPTTWDLVAAIGRTTPKLLASTSSMLEGISSGELLFAYNVVGSYTRERAMHDPAIGIIVPEDYTLVLSRIAFVPVTAVQPVLGKAFLDLLLSQDGQRLLAARSLGSVRSDVPTGWAIAPETARPIHVGPELLVYLDQAKRASFLRQ